MKRVAIVQSNYIPWKGYFDLLRLSDEFILYDDVQYTRRDWRNRNRVKTPRGVEWLTIPVEVKGKYHQRIRDTRISDVTWGKKHWATLTHNYARAPFFGAYREIFEPLYLGALPPMLSDVNRLFLETICPLLDIRTPIRWSDEFPPAAGRSQRLLEICAAAGATEYLSGPAAKGYLDEELFAQASIRVSWMDYSGYRPYPQINGPFVHEVTVLDLIFNVGPDAKRFLRAPGP
jgi:WbqC-like protein family